MATLKVNGNIEASTMLKLNGDWETDFGILFQEGGGTSYGAYIRYGLDDYLTIGTRNSGSDVTAIKIYRGSGNVTVNGTITATIFYGTLSGNATSANSVPWSGITDKPNTFPPSSHTHNHLVGQGTITANQRTQAYSEALLVGGWADDSQGYGWTYGTTLDVSGYSTWYHRLAFRTDGNIEYWQGINTNTLSKIGNLCFTGHTHSYLPLSGGTLTGGLYFSGSNGIFTRHLDGEKSTFAGDLYLNYNNNAPIHVGAGGSYTISADGSYYSGNCNYSNSSGYASSAGSVAWSNISSKPSTFTPSSHTHYNISFLDTRADNMTPNNCPEGLSVHLKTNGADGLTDGGTYHPIFIIKDWGDYSGGPYGQISITANNNLWFRASSSGTEWNSWRNVIHSGNIGSQSVNYASSAGNSDTVDGYHASNFLKKYGWWYSGDSHSADSVEDGIVFAYTSHGVPNYWGTLITFSYGNGTDYNLQLHGAGNNELYFRNRSSDHGQMPWQTIIHSGNYTSYCASLASPNNLMHSTNEFTFVPDAFSGSIWLNYRTAGWSTNGNISMYYFGNGKGGIAPIEHLYDVTHNYGSTNPISYPSSINGYGTVGAIYYYTG